MLKLQHFLHNFINQASLLLNKISSLKKYSVSHFIAIFNILAHTIFWIYIYFVLYPIDKNDQSLVYLFCIATPEFFLCLIVFFISLIIIISCLVVQKITKKLFITHKQFLLKNKFYNCLWYIGLCIFILSTPFISYVILAIISLCT